MYHNYVYDHFFHAFPFPFFYIKLYLVYTESIGLMLLDSKLSGLGSVGFNPVISYL